MQVVQKTLILRALPLRLLVHGAKWANGANGAAGWLVGPCLSSDGRSRQSRRRISASRAKLVSDCGAHERTAGGVDGLII